MSAVTFSARPIAAPAPRGVLARIGLFLRATVEGIQMAQMVRALNQMSDAQLRAINIAREDIPAHAMRLVQGRV